MRSVNKFFVFSLMLFFVFSLTQAAEISKKMNDVDITKKDVIAIVDKAVILLNQKGDEAIPVINKADGEYDKGALYVFVYDENVTMLAHPVTNSLVGKNFKGKADAKGKTFRDEIVKIALEGKGQMGGWVDYVYKKPDDAGLFDKTTYTKLAINGTKKYIVCSGMYKEKK